MRKINIVFIISLIIFIVLIIVLTITTRPAKNRHKVKCSSECTGCQYCSNGKCYDTCTEDSDCPLDCYCDDTTKMCLKKPCSPECTGCQYCSNGKCTNFICNQETDCPSIKCSCIGGYCYSPNCTQNTDCSQCEYCLQGDNGGVCTNDCSTTTGSSFCSSSTGCICSNGLCINGGTGGEPKQFIFEAYTLLPNFQKGLYESRVVVNGQTYPPTSSQGLRWSPSAISIVTPKGNTTFVYSLNEGQNITYTIYDISSQKIITTATYNIKSTDMESATTIYLCDGAIVSDLQFMPNFTYHFTGVWSARAPCDDCFDALLSWSSPQLSGIYTTDNIIECYQNPPFQKIPPFTHSSIYNGPASVGWKGAWIGMTWQLNFCSLSIYPFGSITLTDPLLPNLWIDSSGTFTMHHG